MLLWNVVYYAAVDCCLMSIMLLLTVAYFAAVDFDHAGCYHLFLLILWQHVTDAAVDYMVT